MGRCPIPLILKINLMRYTKMTTLTKLYEQERKLRILEYKILQHFGGYRNRNENILRVPPSLSPWDIEQLDFYERIQQELKVILNKLRKRKTKTSKNFFKTAHQKIHTMCYKYFTHDSITKGNHKQN